MKTRMVITYFLPDSLVYSSRAAHLQKYPSEALPKPEQSLGGQSFPGEVICFEDGISYLLGGDACLAQHSSLARCLLISSPHMRYALLNYMKKTEHNHILVFTIIGLGSTKYWYLSSIQDIHGFVLHIHHMLDHGSSCNLLHRYIHNILQNSMVGTPGHNDSFGQLTLLLNVYLLYIIYIYINHLF